MRSPAGQEAHSLAEQAPGSLVAQLVDSFAGLGERSHVGRGLLQGLHSSARQEARILVGRGMDSLADPEAQTLVGHSLAGPNKRIRVGQEVNNLAGPVVGHQWERPRSFVGQ